MSKHSSFKRFLYGTTAAGLAVVLFSAYRLSFAQLDWRFLVLALITVGIGSRLSVTIPQVKAEITVADTLIFLAMLIYGGEAAILLAAAEGLASSLHVSRKSRVFFFNAAQLTCATFLTVWILRLFLGPIENLHRSNHSSRYLLATCLMASVQFIASSGLVALYTALKNEQPVGNTWRKYYFWTSITYFAGASAASITAELIGGISVYAAIIISPIIAIIYFSYRTFLKNVESSAQLRKSEERYRELFENARDANYVHDLSGRYTSVNRAAEKLTGYTRAEILGKSFINFVPPSQIANIREQWCRKLVEEGETSYESEVTTKDGHRLAVEISSHLILENGVPVGVQGTARDITERKRAEQKLGEYEKAVEGLEEMIVVVDRDYRYSLANRAFLKYSGLERDQLVGRLVSDVLNPAVFKNITRENLAQCFEGNIVKYETKNIFPTLGQRSLFISYFPIENHHGIDRVACVLKDITDSKQAEERLKANSKQLRALSARLQSAREEEGTRIAREIHDELGSVLTSLKWDLEGTAKILTGPIGPSQCVALREKLGELMKLTDQSISAIRRIASELRPSVLDDLGLIAAIEWQAQQFQTRTGIVCGCDCAFQSLGLNDEQSTGIFRILQEALTNVLRHAQATKVDIKMNQEQGRLTLSISDNGRGITEAQKSEQHSLGILGMRERASLIGGKVDIERTGNIGTVVTVRVPTNVQVRALKMTN